MQFAEYVNDHAEELRSKFVDFQGKKILAVYQNYRVPGNEYDIRSSTFNWDRFCSEFSKQIMQNTKGRIADVMACDFSTSGTFEKMASEVVLMS